MSKRSQEDRDKYASYNYAEMSNKVITSERSAARLNEPDGSATSLYGKLDGIKMGDRATVVREKSMKKPKKEAPAAVFFDEDFTGLAYTPSTSETRQTYGLISSLVSGILGDRPRDELKSFVDELLIILMNTELRDFDKKEQIDGELLKGIRKLTSEEFADLVNLSRGLTDFSTGADAEADTLDDYGVAVVFDEDEEDEEEYVVKDDEEDEEDEQQEDEQQPDLDQDIVIKQTAPQTKSEENTALNPHDIDAFWLRRAVSKQFPDPLLAQEKSDAAFDILAADTLLGECENQLMELFDYENAVVKTLLLNRRVIVWCTRLAKAESLEQTAAIQQEMNDTGNGDILNALKVDRVKKNSRRRGVVEDAMQIEEQEERGEDKQELADAVYVPRATLDLEALAFAQGGHLMSNKKCRLPEGSFKKTLKGYEEIHVPVQKAGPVKDKKVSISSLPEWAQKGFPGASELNRIQSKVYPIAFKTDENMLLCAPTGAGKTNCAMLTILRVLSNHRKNGAINTNFKIVYIAPMKALVSEMVENFGKRLAPYSVKVSELTGDSQLTKDQIASTQLIISTPEKYDIITRKATDASYTSSVELVIIDEIHLLHDDRGPVLESIVVRTLRAIESTQKVVRLVGLSATLPNYTSVQKFLRVSDSACFFFDNTFRPCPLAQQFIGIQEKKAIKRFAIMNQIVYDKVMEQQGSQVLIFTHSRKETAKCGKTLRDMVVEAGTVLLADGASSREILSQHASSVTNADLAELLPYGIGIHHAGMNKADRSVVESLFKEGHVTVLCSTATLAWGVNLPAHTVIIRGTQIYNPERGTWMELSGQDVLQMLGRAGRPQYDTHGEGIIITQHSELQYYLSLLNAQLPIESQYISKLADNLNAEIVLGTVGSREEAVEWLGYTYLYVRMRENPVLYGADTTHDVQLVQKRVDLVHAAATLLEKSGLVKYDRKAGTLAASELGRIASHYYITHRSMRTYNTALKPGMSLIDTFRVFAQSDEFKYIPVRAEERVELGKLLERVPVPVKESPDDPCAKINVLLQAHVSGLKLEGFALMADMVFVTQSAGRILRAIYEICLRRGWAFLAAQCLSLCKMVERRMWASASPLRQFTSTPQAVIERLERKEFPWYRYFDLNTQELGELAGLPKEGKRIHSLVHAFPRVDVGVYVQPVTRSLIKIDATLTPAFEYDVAIHGLFFFIQGPGVGWHVWVLDHDAETILHHEYVVIKSKYATQPHHLTMHVALYSPLPPVYFIHVTADRWIHAETRVPVSFKHLVLPTPQPPPTELLDLQPKPVSSDYADLFSFSHFNAIQTQVWNAIHSVENVFIGAPHGSGKSACMILAIMSLWRANPKGQCVVITPLDSQLQTVTAQLCVLEKVFGGKRITTLVGDTASDLNAMGQSDKTMEDEEASTGNWFVVINTDLVIALSTHLIASTPGPVLEIILSRTRYMAAQIEKQMRIVLLSAPIANARDVAEWMGVTPQNTFNFPPSARPSALEIHIQTFNIPHFPSLMLAMLKPTFKAVAAAEQSIVYVPGRKYVAGVVGGLITLAAATGKEWSCEPGDCLGSLAAALSHGIAFWTPSTTAEDKRVVSALWKSGRVKVVVTCIECVHAFPLSAPLVVIMGTQSYYGKEHRYTDVALPDMLEMMRGAAKCVVMCPVNKREYYKKFLYEPLPVESHLDHYLHDHFNAEIVAKTIERVGDGVDYLTWTLYYRRLLLNPNYYNLQLDSSTQKELLLSDHLSELVESTLEDLSTSKCITVSEDSVSPLNLGMIASYYYVTYTTMELFAMSLSPKTKVKGLLEIIAAASEFESIPIRTHEDSLLSKINEKIPYPIPTPDYTDPHAKAHILLQSHISRIQLPQDLELDLAVILSKIIPLIYAAVDVISSNGWLNPALAAMDLAQMITQAIWQSDSPLRQIPHLTQTHISALSDQQVSSIYDFMEMDDDVRLKTLELSDKEMASVAAYCNAYPSLSVSHSLSTPTVPQHGSGVVAVTLERDEPSPGIKSPFFPVTRQEGWWIVVGDPKSKTVLGIKRVVLVQSVSVKLEFSIGDVEVGPREVTLYVVADGWIGADQEFGVQVEVIEGEESEDESEDED